ncbi:TonB-dependent receptor [Fulvivirgaceae bacterium BMA12]|uniref:TonB-dependent receptor n=1 Tax=Agaribacillus aureus TaxID=3051825 RepID=A0ABT8L980_9BACT|nr:TonB-dependent receptor [Fulvivirgaceae bacterium BMA12]
MSKLSIIPLLITLLLIDLSGFGQSDDVVLISETFYKVPLVKVLKKLKKKYDIKFAYDHKLLTDHKVTQNIYQLPVAEAVGLLLEGTHLRFRVAEQGVIILPPARRKTFPISAEIRSSKPLNIKGVIKDSQTGETLPFANIRVHGADAGTTSNVDGFFSLLGLPSGSSTLEITYLGYVTKLVSLRDYDIRDRLVINLTSKTEILEELVVEEKKSDMIYNGDNIGQISMNPSRLLSLPSLGEVDIFRTLQYLPGISGTDETSAGLVIRGSTPDQNLILFDGFSVYHIDHFFGIFSAFNSNAIKNIQIYKGAFESKYGGRASSVIDITGKTGNMNRASYGFGVNLISANAVLELPIGKKLSLFMAGRRSHTDILQTGLYREIFDKVILENRDIISNLREAEFEDIEPVFNFYDLNGKLTYRPSSRDVLSWSYYSGRDNLDIDANQDFSYRTIDEASNIGFRANVDWQVDDYSNWGNDGTSLRWGRQWSQKFYSNINLAYSEYRLEQDNFEKLLFSIPVLEIDTLLRDRTQRIRNSLSDVSIRWDNQLKIGKKSELAFGSLYTKNEIDFQFSINGESADSFSDRGEQLTFYVQNTFYPFDNLGITFGVRNNHYDVIGEDFIEPRASLHYQVSPKIKLKAAWGKHNQFINRILFEENLYDVNSSFWLLADGNNIPHVVSEHLVAGISYESDNWLIDVEAYRKDTEGITDFFPDLKVSDSGEDELVNVFLAGNSVATGVDFLIQKKTGKHTGWLSYSLSKVENSFPDLNGGRPFAASQDQRHELKLVNMMSAGRWDLSSTWVYGSGKPFSDPGKGSPLVTLDSLNTYYVAVDNINTERLPAYHRLDLAAAYNFNLGKGKAQFGLSVYNVYGRKNVKYKRFSTLDIDEITNDTATTADDEPVYLASDVLLLGFTPNFFFNFRF